MKIEDKYEERITQFISDTDEMVKKATERAGECLPTIVILSVKETERGPDFKVAVIALSLFDENTKNNMSKIVELCSRKMLDGYVPLCVAFLTEAWLRQMPPGQEIPHNWKELPKTEAVQCMYETEYSAKMHFWDLTRDGKTINEDGDLINKVTLTWNPLSEKGDNLSGRLTGFFRKYSTHNNKN